MNSTGYRRRSGLGALSGCLLIFFRWLATDAAAGDPNPFPGTQPLTMSGDIATNLVAGAHRFLDRELAESVAQRARFWQRDTSTASTYEALVATNRARLAHILGVRDVRPAEPQFEFVSSQPGSGPFASTGRYGVFRVRWLAFGDVHGEGLLLRPSPMVMDPRLAQRYGLPTPPKFVGDAIIALPDADQTPEQIAGLADGVPAESQFARRLAESGCQVLIPTLIDRRRGLPKSPLIERGKTLSSREFLYRPAFELGRHLVGYEVQKVLAAVDWLVTQPAAASPGEALHKPKVGVLGWGEGGMLALYAGALDSRIAVVGVSGYFGPREQVWQEPIERNVFGLLERFGDAELAGLVAPRALIIDAARGPEVVVPPGTGGGPGRLATPVLDQVRAEFERATKLVDGLRPKPRFELVVSGDGAGPYWSQDALARFLEALAPKASLAKPDAAPIAKLEAPTIATRHARQLHELDRHTQQLLTESSYVRADFMKRLDTSSPDKYRDSVATYREIYARDVIGRFERPLLPPNPRSRPAYDQPKWTGYEVVLDVFPDLFAYGVLLVPKDLKAGERRPVVVCQHGLEGRPQDVIQGDNPAYHDFAAKLAERGFITFAPQNLYLFEDRFRELQRKANPLGKTLFSLIIPQHQQITEWLRTLPMVDPARIGFYGLSYGGKTAMRVPALVTNYCLSICSADFNEWVWKNASTRSPYSYVWTGEYEIFEFDLGSTFNYAEMAALIAPRPFMVERGHFDGVAPDETVGYEFAKVRHLYAARLGLGDRCELEWFVGPHTINGQGTFDFLHRHLNWPKP